MGMQMKAEEKAGGAPGTAGKPGRMGEMVTDIVLFCVLTALFLMLSGMLLAMLFPGAVAAEGAAEIRFLILSEALLLFGVLLAAGGLLRFRRVPFERLGLSVRGQWRSLPGGILLVALLYAVGLGVSLLSGAVEVAGLLFSPASLLTSLFFFFLVAVAEEVAVRGFILGRMLDAGVNRYVALLLSALLFSLMHIFNPDFAPVPFLNIVLAGLFLGASYLYTRNLCFPIVLHWFWNWIQGPVLGYKVSGNAFGGGSLLILRLPEPNLLNGGEFGFEGSLLCSLLLVAGTALILRHFRRAG